MSRCDEPRKKRLDYLDIAKGIGILLVVIGHDLAISTQFTIWIYSFHMPLFFIISGWLYAYRAPAVGIREIIKNKAASLLYPYCVFSVLIILWKVLLYVCLGSVPDVSFLKIFLQTIFTYGYHALWFLPALFLAEVVLHLIESKFTEKIKKSVSYGAIILVGFLIIEFRSVFLCGMTVEFAIRYVARVCIAVMFCKIGMLLYKLNILLLPWMKAFLFATCASVSVFCSGTNGLVNISVGNVGFFVLYVMLGVCGSVAVILLCQFIKKDVFFSFFGKIHFL